MTLWPSNLTELSDNVFFWLLTADKFILPRLFEMPPSRTRREVIQHHEDLFGHLHAFLEILPQTKARKEPAETENILKDFLQSVSDDICFQFMEDKQTGITGGLKPPVTVDTWRLLQEIYLVAGGQAAIFIARPDIRNQLNPALIKSAADVAKQILFTWNFINLTFAEVTGEDFNNEGETDNEI